SLSKSPWSSTTFKTWALNIGDVEPIGGLAIHPNPVAEQLFVYINSNTPVGELSVSDAMGRVLKTARVTDKEMSLDVADLPSGVYMLNYSANGTQEQMRFTKL